MKFTPALKVGILTLISVAILICSVMWLKGRSIASGERITVIFQDVDGMRAGSGVQIMGLRVGQVEEINPFITQESSYVSVKLVITEPGVEIPVGSEISIQQSGIIGEKFVEITPPKVNYAYLPLKSETTPVELQKGDGVEVYTFNDTREDYTVVGEIKTVETVDRMSLPLELREQYEAPYIAKGSVMAETVGSEVVLNLEGTLQHQIAVAVLDLQDANELKGNAIIGTEYSLEYNSESGEYELNVKEDKYATIDVQSRSGNSFVVLFPNEEEDTRLKCIKGDKTYATTFYGDIKANKVYFKTGTDGTSQEPLTWTEMQAVNGYEYVDLGLPSGLKWATCNVGASSPEEYGDYFAWGETETKSVYTYDNSLTFEKTPEYLKANGYIDDEGNLTPEHDAAAANWGGSWRMPTKEQMEELVEHCEWEWTQVNGVNGAKVIGPNGSCIFLPAAGYRYGSSLSSDGDDGSYWSSTPDDDAYDNSAYYLYFFTGSEYVGWDGIRHVGLTVRPLTE